MGGHKKIVDIHFPFVANIRVNPLPISKVVIFLLLLCSSLPV